MTLTGSGGNATVDTAGYTVTLSGSLSGPGGLAKTDSGTLVLAASNTYTGGTIVEAGILVASNGSNGSATGSGSVTLSGGTLASGTGGGSISGEVADRLPRIGNRPRRHRLGRQAHNRQFAGRLEPDHARLRLDHARRQRRPAGRYGQPGTGPGHCRHLWYRPHNIRRLSSDRLWIVDRQPWRLRPTSGAAEHDVHALHVGGPGLYRPRGGRARALRMALLGVGVVGLLGYVGRRKRGSSLATQRKIAEMR